MGNEAPSLLLSGVWLIPLIILATLAAAYLVARRFRGQASDSLQASGEALRQLKAERRALFSSAQAALPSDPEPYGSRAAALSSQIQQASNQVTLLEKRLNALQERFQQPSPDRWSAIIAAPILWYQIRTDAAILEEDVDQARRLLAETSSQQQALERIAWEIAMQGRELHSIEKKTAQGFDLLRQKGIQGTAFEDALGLLQQHQADVAQIPYYFLHDSRQAVLQQAEKAAVIQVFEIIQRTRTGLTRLLSQAQNWETQHQQAREQVGAMRQTLGQADQSLAGSSAHVDSVEARRQLDQIKVIATQLEVTLSRVEAESISQVALEAGRVSQAALEIEAKMKRAGEQGLALERGLLELQDGLKKLSYQFGSLGTRSRYPIAWGSGTARLAEVNRQANLLGLPTGAAAGIVARSPEQIEKDLALCQRLLIERNELASYAQEVETQSARLIGLFDQQEFSQADTWLPAASQAAQQGREYAPENWSKLDAPGNLAGDLNRLRSELQQLLPGSENEAIPEAEINVRLQDTQKLLDNCQALHRRFDGIQARLTALQSSEKLAREQMENAQNLLGQLAFVVRSNPRLMELAAQPLSRLQRDVQDLLGEIGQRQRGLVEKKARLATETVGRIEQEASNWLERLTQDSRAAVQEMSELMQALEGIAPLEDAALAEAHRLLAEAQQLGISAQSVKRYFKLEELLAEFKRRSDFWQKCNAALRALQEVSRPVFGMVEQTRQARQEALDILNQLPAPQKNKRAWPPSSVTVETERRSVDDLEAQWQDLKDTRIKAIDLVEQLGRLSNRYQSVATKLRQSAAQVEQDRRQIGDLEEELDELTTRWRENWRKCGDYPEASQDIRQLLDSVEADLKSFQQQYQQGTRNYSQVHQALKMLVRKVKTYQVELDEDHALDASGNTITRREAKRINPP